MIFTTGLHQVDPCKSLELHYLKLSVRKDQGNKLLKISKINSLRIPCLPNGSDSAFY